MTEPEARALFAKIAAAFPAARREDATTRVYVELLTEWGDPLRALAAVNNAIRGHTDARTLPPLAALIENHAALRDRFARPELEEAAVSEEQMAENMRQARAFLAHLDANSRLMQPETRADVEAKRKRAESL